ncbi:MAG: imidazoleglycerol-phosphate dehydratase HisB [Chloroflexi bacterium]|nr:imidazoleglycerol-phosphate dehydratase HisB [Chloroflexota bacterium]
MSAQPQRKATITRRTGETTVEVRLAIDGAGRADISTGLTMFDHMLAQLAKHGAFDLAVSAKSTMDPDGHHMVEDVAIALGQAFNQALGDKRGIVRMGHAIVPLDEALAQVAVDISGRGYALVQINFDLPKLGDLLTDLARHFLHTFAYEARLNLHAKLLSGVNDHHKLEAVFKALAKALYHAVKVDPRLAGEVPSTKGVIEG